MADALAVLFFLGCSLLALGLPVGLAFRQDRLLHLRLPAAKSFKWGYYTGFGLVIGAPIAFLGLLPMYLIQGDPEVLLPWMLLGIPYWILGVFILKRHRWAWIVYTVISISPWLWVINTVYIKNRWQELGDDRKVKQHPPTMSEKATPTARFKLIAFAELIAYIIGWFLILILAVAIQAPPQATATFMLFGIVGIPIGIIRLVLILVGVIKHKGDEALRVHPSNKKGESLSAQPQSQAAPTNREQSSPAVSGAPRNAERPIETGAFYEKALDEIENKTLDRATWARSFSEASGDDTKAKALYIKLRVPGLVAEEQDRRNAEFQNALQQARLREAIKSPPPPIHSTSEKKATQAARQGERQKIRSREFAARWRPRIGFVVCQAVVALIYWIGSGLAFVDEWPGFVNIQRGFLISSFLWSLLVLACIGFVLWLPVLGILKLINRKKVYSPYVFVVVVSLVLGILDITKTYPLISGTEGCGVWDGVKEALVARGTPTPFDPDEYIKKSGGSSPSTQSPSTDFDPHEFLSATAEFANTPNSDPDLEIAKSGGSSPSKQSPSTDFDPDAFWAQFDMPDPYLAWTDTSGRTVEARLIGYSKAAGFSESTVKLLKRDGSVVTVKCSDLAAQSVKYLNSLRISQKSFMRTWTDTNGNSINAAYVGDKDGLVTLMLTSGNIDTLRRDQLSAKDIEYLDSL